MVNVKSIHDLIPIIEKDERIQQLVKDNPAFTMEHVIGLYLYQWKYAQSFLRTKQGFNLDIPGLGYFKANHFAIPYVIVKKEYALQNIYDQQPWEEGKLQSIRAQILDIKKRIDRLYKIIEEVHEKHPKHSKEFNNYWSTVLIRKPLEQDKWHLLRYYRRVLEKLNIPFDEEKYKEAYTSEEGDVPALHFEG